MQMLMSFSGQFEDVILFNVLEDQRDVFWIDVGAADPILNSVTKLFSQKGCYGVNIDAQRIHVDKLTKDRPNDINLEVGISDKEGELTLYGNEGSELASFDKDNVWNIGSIKTVVKVTTLSKICEDYVGERSIHFLKIDVEGWESQCLRGADFKKYRPWIVCIESVTPRTEKPTYNTWESILLDADYIFIYQVGVNRYYLSKEKQDLRKKFLNPKELRKKYEVINYNDIKRLYRFNPIIRIIDFLRNSKLLIPVRFIWHTMKSILGKI